ncbi:MAG: hypothetical protein H6936_08480 [Burkholderiales bacterium]|nr:hypothetical protein [Burkholderiales bacterium]
MRKKWKRPDWTKENEYSYLDGNTSNEIWAWEFLRRNPEYQIAYNESRHKNNEGKQTFGPDTVDLYTWFELEPKSKICDPGKLIPPSFYFKKYPHVNFPIRPLSQQSRNELPEYEFLFVLSIDHDIGSQLKLLKKFLEDEERSAQKPPVGKKKNYIKYLRVLDGFEAGAENDEIYNIVDDINDQKGNSSLERHVRIAEYLCHQRGYRYLIRSSKYA